MKLGFIAFTYVLIVQPTLT